jgi:membrane associated rhomboid family serine protease
MSYGLNDEQDYPRITHAVKWIIAINVAIAFLQLTVWRPELMYEGLGFQSSDFSENKWWSVATYMFVHGGPMHLAVNMYMLFVFGPRLEYSWSPASFTRFYLWCGLGGLLAHMLLGGGSGLIGASAAVMGVMFGYAASWPEEEMFLFGVIPMKVKWLVAFFVVVNLVSGILSMGQGGGVAYFAHLGGIAFGWLYLRTPSVGNLDRIRHRVSPVPDETDEPPRAVPRSLPRNRERMSEIDEIVAKSNAVAPRRNSTLMPPRKAETNTAASDALDLVLDKISEYGLESLTPAERKLLEDMSRELRREP